MSSSKTDFQNRLFVLGIDEFDRQQTKRFSHWISIINPGGSSPRPPGFDGAHLQLCFGDVVSEADAQQCRTKAATIQDVQKVVEFFRAACLHPNSKVLVSCDYGASRSPALAYVCIADQFGEGREPDALNFVLGIRPNAVPNRLVVQLGDTFLGRHGALLRPAKQLYSRINDEISKWRASRGEDAKS